MNVRPFALILASLLTVPALAQDEKPAAPRPDPATFQTRTFVLHNAAQANDANEIQIALRNILSAYTKIYLVTSRREIVIRASAEDLALAERLIHDLDGTPSHAFRVNYTIIESDSGKRVGVQHFSLQAIEGQRTVLKQGSKVPVLTGSYDKDSQGQETQFTYIDIGNNVDVTVDRQSNGLRLKSKVEQSSLAPEQSSDPVLRHDPIVRQTVIEGTSLVPAGKPALIGGSDVAGTTRHYDVEVMIEPVD